LWRGRKGQGGEGVDLRKAKILKEYVFHQFADVIRIQFCRYFATAACAVLPVNINSGSSDFHSLSASLREGAV
jgi:hypothetical protein